MPQAQGSKPRAALFGGAKVPSPALASPCRQWQQSRTSLLPWHSNDERRERTGLCSDLRAEPQNSREPSLQLPGCLGRTGQQSQPFQWDRMVGEIHRSPGNKNNNHNKNTKPEITYTHTNTQARTLPIWLCQPDSSLIQTAHTFPSPSM